MDQYILLIAAILTSTVSYGSVLIYASVGEIVTERSGILNLGLEGMMLVGASFGFITVYDTHSLPLAILVAMTAGGVMGLLHAFITITLRASQEVSGLSLTALGTGLASFFGQKYTGSEYVRPVGLEAVKIPLLSDIPYIGDILFNQNILVYLSILLVPAVYIFIYKTRWGLRLRAVGENPAAADAAGISVFKIRYLSTVFGGVMAGLSGAFLSLAYQSKWMDNITGGAGWIAVALVIFASWNPSRAIWGCYLFAMIRILGLKLQAFNISVPIKLFEILPYLATVVVLILTTASVRRKIGASPASLGLSYSREER